MFQPPTGYEIAGLLRWRRPPTPYEIFMEEEGIPIYRGMGVYDVRQLPLAPWRRMGGRGTFLQLDGLGGVKGLYVVEVPSAGVLNPERHFYDELIYVVEGRGTTEVWREGSSKKQTFEWQAGSYFNIPLNTWHRMVNATTSPALLLAATNAPPIMEIFPSRRFIFENPFEFPERFNEDEEYYRVQDELIPHPVNKRAVLPSNLIPDIVNCELPLDNQRAPGYRRIEPRFRGLEHQHAGFIAEYPSGRYSKAHAHQSGAVLVCLRGKGYTYAWPVEIGTRPWEAGKAEFVKRQDYVPGGLVSAAPGGGNWFHQHFGISKDYFRVLNLWGGPLPTLVEGSPGDEVVFTNANLEEGGRSIDYPNEDPWVRKEYERMLKEEGCEFTMPEWVYTGRRPEGVR